MSTDLRRPLRIDYRVEAGGMELGYVHLRDSERIRTSQPIEGMLVVDLDEAGAAIGIEILDYGPDAVAACNQVLADHGYAPLSLADLRRHPVESPRITSA